jgi:hypothetical protein
MSTYRTGVTAFDSTANVSEGVRQAAVAVATTQAAARSADILHYRNLLASAKANGIQPGQFIFALLELGTGGL